MSDSTNTKNVASEDAKTSTIDSGLAKSLTMYRKLIESGGTLTDEQQAELEKKIKVIQERDVVEADTPHDPLEIEFEKNISIGPPTLTRFEKARILGARALQLSLGAPTVHTHTRICQYLFRYCNGGAKAKSDANRNKKNPAKRGLSEHRHRGFSVIYILSITSGRS